MSTTRIDFRTLSLKDALDLAILVEEEAHERYLELRDQLETHRTPEAAAFFLFMAGNEARHGEELLERRRALFGTTPRAVDRSMLWDVEAPEYDRARASMTARSAMKVALECETKAHDFFAAALPHVTDETVRALFEELREEEVLHQKLVREQLARLPEGPGEAWSDVGDEPVAQ